MAISKSFGGMTIVRPGAYSTTSTTPANGNQSGQGVLFLVGEADAGPGGADVGLQTYSAAAFAQMQAVYKSGPLMDDAKAALAPSRTPGVNGASTFVIWKTNRSGQATYAQANTYGTLKADEYGVGGNRITYKNVVSTETAPQVVGTAVVTATTALDAQTLLLREAGGTLTTVTFSSVTALADVLTQINAAATWLTATAPGGILTLAMNSAANHHRDGVGRAFEVEGGTALSNLFLTAQMATAAAEPQASFEIIQPRDSLTQTGVVGGDIALSLGRDASGSCTAATVTTTGTTLTLAQTGATPASVAFAYANYPTIGNLVDGINATTGWKATCAPALRGAAATTLDQVSAIGCFSPNGNQPGQIKHDVADVQAFFDPTILGITITATKGLPDTEGRVNLAGGTRGSSASSDFSNGLAASLATDWNVVVPCISQDATADITAGLTDPASAYSIATVLTAVSTHLALRGNLKNRKEAQANCGFRNVKKATCFQQAASLQTAELQLAMEDVLVVDATNNLAWKQPHTMAALMAGIRLGTETGEPLTHKYLNCQGVGHYVNASTGAVQGDYNPQIDYDAAIQAGITSSEPANGSFRVMLDNTTYGIDQNFVWNRGSVVNAAQYAVQYVRNDAESVFVGQKANSKKTIVTASGVKNRVRAKLIELYDANILSADATAPQGFREDTFVVTVSGNTTTVQVEALPVNGNDFVLLSFSMGEASTTA